MRVNVRELAERLGVKVQPTVSTAEDLVRRYSDSNVEMRIVYFKRGDPAHSWVTSDGSSLSLGVPVEDFRQEVGKLGGVFVGPFGTNRVEIPAYIRDGDGYYVSVSYELRPRANRRSS